MKVIRKIGIRPSTRYLHRIGVVGAFVLMPFFFPFMVMYLNGYECFPHEVNRWVSFLLSVTMLGFLSCIGIDFVRHAYDTEDDYG